MDWQSFWLGFAVASTINLAWVWACLPKQKK
jgi:hypothetical protein